MTEFNPEVGDGFEFENLGVRKYIGKENGKYVFEPVLGEPSTNSLRLSDDEVQTAFSIGEIKENGKTYPVSETAQYETEYRRNFDQVA